ncbi:MAG: hypothetical protein IJU39_02980 [Clostridia bacterium]|nr:hypothetical protein [Clostridia bacterium]
MDVTAEVVNVLVLLQYRLDLVGSLADAAFVDRPILQLLFPRCGKPVLLVKALVAEDEDRESFVSAFELGFEPFDLLVEDLRVTAGIVLVAEENQLAAVYIV